MDIALAILLIAHGFAHTVGFVVYWQISDFEEIRYKTTILNGKIDVKDTGIRVIGIFWLLLALAFVFNGIILIIGLSFWEMLSLSISIISLVFCILCLPDTKVGIVVNIIILLFLFLNQRYLFIL